uniref:Ig-like domain-containing protein n=1 Tax=Sinocyclocheilus rhinocerous TaxID=307959 RepID=A0A673JFJ6_9TELE
SDILKSRFKMSIVSSRITDTQPDLTVNSKELKPGQPLSLSCKVSGYSLSSCGYSWIRQPAGKALEWIGLIDSAGNLAYKDSLRNKFSITRDTSSNTITLQGKNMRAEDTAVYYCARASQCLMATASLYKNIIVIQIRVYIRVYNIFIV